MKNLKIQDNKTISDRTFAEVTGELKRLWRLYDTKEIKHYQYTVACDEVYKRFNITKESFNETIIKMATNISR